MRVAWMVAGSGEEKRIEVPGGLPSPEERDEVWKGLYEKYGTPRLEVRVPEPKDWDLTELEKAVIFGG
jgi:hypothetical protein